jgi:hypothetical protein
MSKARCRACEKEVTKVFGHRAKNNRVVYVDSLGKAWGGRLCPPCRSQDCMKYAKASVKEEVEGGLVMKKKKTPLRKCRDCGVKLPESKYFKCIECDNSKASEGQGHYSAEDWGYGCLGGSSETTSFKISEIALLGAQ